MGWACGSPSPASIHVSKISQPAQRAPCRAHREARIPHPPVKGNKPKVAAWALSGPLVPPPLLLLPIRGDCWVDLGTAASTPMSLEVPHRGSFLSRGNFLFRSTLYSSLPGVSYLLPRPVGRPEIVHPGWGSCSLDTYRQRPCPSQAPCHGPSEVQTLAGQHFNIRSTKTHTTQAQAVG